MAISSRASLALGLGLLGVAGLVGVSHGQQDGAVRKAAGTGTAGAAAAPAAMKPTVIATIDLETVVRGYEKAKYQAEQLQAEALAKMGQLKAVASEAQQIAKEMESLQSSSKDFKDRGARLSELKAKLTAGKETLQAESQMKQVEMMAGFYKEAQDMIGRFAKSRGITCVVQISALPVKSEDPESVMAALGRSVVYADPSMDITRSILWNMNKEYTESGGPIAKNPPPGGATIDDAAKPASAERPTAAPAARPVAAPKGQK